MKEFPILDTGSTLLTPRDIRLLADYQEIVPTKKKGQNFLLDPNTVRMIVEKSRVKAGDPVVEVGPGLGSLTLGLLEAGALLTAVELDSALAQILPQTLEQKGFSQSQYALLNADALQATELPLPVLSNQPPMVLVANLPYNVATPILLTFFERFDFLQRALVMVQLEVAERIAATPGSKIYGAPSVKAAWYGSRALAGRISRQVFWPVPNVDSALVEVNRDRIADPNEPSREAVFSVIDAAFAQRRKTLRAALKNWAGGSEAVDAVLNSAGIDSQSRGETLEVEQFIAIAKAKAEL